MCLLITRYLWLVLLAGLLGLDRPVRFPIRFSGCGPCWLNDLWFTLTHWWHGHLYVCMCLWPFVCMCLWPSVCMYLWFYVLHLVYRIGYLYFKQKRRELIHNLAMLYCFFMFSNICCFYIHCLTCIKEAIILHYWSYIFSFYYSY